MDNLELFRAEPREGVDPAERHFRLAMRAARRIGSTRSKRRTGHLICEHLRRMLESEDARPDAGRRPASAAPAPPTTRARL